MGRALIYFGFGGIIKPFLIIDFWFLIKNTKAQSVRTGFFCFFMCLVVAVAYQSLTFQAMPCHYQMSVFFLVCH